MGEDQKSFHTVQAEAEEKQKTERQRAKNEHDELIADIKWMLSDARGRRIAATIFFKCDVLNVTEALNAQLHLREGKRILGNWWMRTVVNADPKQFNLMLEEFYNERTRK